MATVIDTEQFYEAPMSRETVETLLFASHVHIKTGLSLDEIIELDGTRGQDSVGTKLLREPRNRHVREALHAIEVSHPEMIDVEIPHINWSRHYASDNMRKTGLSSILAGRQ
jgi:hypothetical protein